MMAAKLITPPKEGRVLGGNEVCADTPGRDGSAESSGCRSGIHPDRWRRDDCIRESGVIQHLAGFLGNICKVAAVEADAVEVSGIPASRISWKTRIAFGTPEPRVS